MITIKNKYVIREEPVESDSDNKRMNNRFMLQLTITQKNITIDGNH